VYISFQVTNVTEGGGGEEDTQIYKWWKTRPHVHVYNSQRWALPQVEKSYNAR